MRNILNQIQSRLSNIPSDKLLHFFYGSALAFVLNFVFTDIYVLTLLFVVATVKEVLDETYRDSQFSIIDIIYTILPGIFLIINNL